MSLRIRKTKTFGGLRLTASKSGVSPSIGTRHIRASRRGASVRILPGLSWFLPRRRETDE